MQHVAPAGTLQPLTRKEFYDLAVRCREMALELARHEQVRVSLRHCHEFNTWLRELKAYDRLGPRLASMQPARPIARWQVMTLCAVAIAFAALALPGRLDRMATTAVLSSLLFGLMILYFVPERVYGTTVELLEGKVLRVVDELEQMLQANELGFTEAAFYKVRDNLHAARRELREQIDLAHRR